MRRLSRRNPTEQCDFQQHQKSAYQKTCDKDSWRWDLVPYTAGIGHQLHFGALAEFDCARQRQRKVRVSGSQLANVVQLSQGSGLDEMVGSLG